MGKEAAEWLVGCLEGFWRVGGLPWGRISVHVWLQLSLRQVWQGCAKSAVGTCTCVRYLGMYK